MQFAPSRILNNIDEYRQKLREEDYLKTHSDNDFPASFGKYDRVETSLY